MLNQLHRISHSIILSVSKYRGVMLSFQVTRRRADRTTFACNTHCCLVGQLYIEYYVYSIFSGSNFVTLPESSARVPRLILWCRLWRRPLATAPTRGGLHLAPAGLRRPLVLRPETRGVQQRHTHGAVLSVRIQLRSKGRQR